MTRLDYYAFDKFKVHQEDAGSEAKLFTENITLDDLLNWQGQFTQDYYDLSRGMAKAMLPKIGDTLSAFETPFMDKFEGSSIKTNGKNWVRWRIYGDPDVRFMSAGNKNDESDCGLGLNGEEFAVSFDCEGFRPGDVVAPLINKRCGVVITDDGSELDGVWQYQAVLFSENEVETFEPLYLTEGEYWIKLGNISSWEATGQRGSMTLRDNFAYVEYEVPLTTMAFEYRIEGEAHRRWGSMKVNKCMTDEDGRERELMKGRISNIIEAKVQREARVQWDMMLTWGTKTEHLIDKVSNKEITTSPGVKEWQEMGTVIPYNPNVDGLDFIIDTVNQYWYDRVPVGDRILDLETGQIGMQLFSDWVRDKFNATPAMYSYDFLLNRRRPFDPRDGRKGFAFSQPQFVEYHLDGYGIIRVSLNKSFDNTRINGAKMPGKYYPPSSLEFVVTNAGLGQSNIKMVENELAKRDTYKCNLWSPLGEVNSKNPIWKNPITFDDHYSRYFRDSRGIVMMNPHLTLTFKPNVSYS